MMMSKWRVERVGSPSNYGPGWIAMNGDGSSGAYFATHPEAVAFAFRAASTEFERDSKRGLMKLASRGVQGAGFAPEMPEGTKAIRSVHRDARAASGTRSYTRVTDTQIRAAAAMRTLGRSWREVGSALGVNTSTIRRAVERAA